jgi:hypothetical protein
MAHALGVVDVLAEDERPGEAVRGAQELGDLGRNQRRALFQDQVAVVVGGNTRQAG